MKNLIIGTSGHIDHGKTALIKALNGFDGDGLEDEIKRGITIDLSFSNLITKEAVIAFIDVPGHENLLKTMISGAYGFDYCMLVVDANEGLMPQTKEHIEVLNFLGSSGLILVISKCDLATINTAKGAAKEIEEFVGKFKNLKILKSFFVSSKTSQGIDELKDFLLDLTPKPKDDSGVFRCYIDRVFSIKGSGTVVTTTLLEGSLQKGDRVFNLNSSKTMVVKNLQIQNASAQIATPSNRVAINLLDVSVGELKKGQILSKKGFYRGFKEAGCVVSGEVVQNQSVIFCVGSAQSNAKISIIDESDESKFVVFKFENEMFLKFNEPFVILANSRVVGGGRVLNPVMEPLKKQSYKQLLSLLERMDFKEVFLFLSKIHRHGFGLFSSLQRFNLSRQKALLMCRELSGVIVDEDEFCLYSQNALDDVKEHIKFIISKNPSAVISASSISLTLTWSSKKLAGLALDELNSSGILEFKNGVYIKFGADFQKIKELVENRIYDMILQAGITPPAPYAIYDSLEIDRTTGDSAMKKLCSSKKLIRLTHNLFISHTWLVKVVASLRQIAKEEGRVNVTNVKSRLNLSRKFAIAYLEYLDRFDDVKKAGDDRVID